MQNPSNIYQSLFNISSLEGEKYNIDTFSDHIEIELSSILKQVFYGDLEKQRIKKTFSDFNFACPFCRDSVEDPRKKRAHLSLKGQYAGYFKCFNCGKFMKIDQFFKAFKSQLDLGSIDFIQQNFTNFHKKIKTSNVSFVDKDLFTEWSLERNFLKERLSLLDPGEKGEQQAYKFLQLRHQSSSRHFLVDPKSQWLFILNMIDNDHCLDIQIRDLSKTRRMRYKTLKLQNLRNSLLKDSRNVPLEVSKYSGVFNLFQVNINKPIMVTEGPLDSFLLPNAISSCGASNKIELDFPFYYLFDSDQTGKKHSIDNIKKGNYVFLWSKFMREYEIPNRKKWDINDVYLWFIGKGLDFKKIIWSNYFSNDYLDILEI